VNEIRGRPRHDPQHAQQKFGGKTYFDVRLWVEPRDQPGAAFIPTRRGLSLPLEFLPEIGEALEAIDEATKRDQGELASRPRRRNAGEG
jgi:hypothetical protein